MILGNCYKTIKNECNESTDLSSFIEMVKETVENAEYYYLVKRD